MANRRKESYPGSSAGKKSTCSAGDPGSILGLERCPGDWVGYALQYSWASLVAQTVKNPPANAGDMGLIPGLGRFPGEGIGYALQYSWASLVVQVAKNPLEMWETWVRSLGGRSAGGGHGNPIQYSCLENPHGQRSLAGYIHGVSKSWA